MKLGDVGRAELGAENYASNLKFNGHDAIGLGVTQLTNANALEVNRDCLAALEQLSKQFPPGLKYQVAFNTTTVVGESIRDVLYTLGTAIILVILVIFIFLQDWRTTLIPAVTIPVSLIGTFAFVKVLGGDGAWYRERDRASRDASGPGVQLQHRDRDGVQRERHGVRVRGDRFGPGHRWMQVICA